VGTRSSLVEFVGRGEIWRSVSLKMCSWFYQLPLPARREEAEAAVALLRLAEELACPLSGMEDAGGDRGGAVGEVVSQERMPQSILDL
jgi:hypothetical protein